MPKSTDTVTDEQVTEKVETEVTLEGLARIVMGLAEKVDAIASRPAPAPTEYPTELPRAKSAREILAGMRRGEAREGSEYFGPPGMRRRFLDNDIIQLTDPDKLKAYIAGGLAKKDEPVYGVIKSLMYHKRKTGEPKYKVDFGKGINDDGVMETGLTLVQRG